MRQGALRGCGSWDFGNVSTYVYIHLYNVWRSRTWKTISQFESHSSYLIFVMNCTSLVVTGK